MDFLECYFMEPLRFLNSTFKTTNIASNILDL